MTVVYIDRVILLNSVIDYLLLLSTARLAGMPLQRCRLAIASLVLKVHSSFAICRKISLSKSTINRVGYIAIFGSVCYNYDISQTKGGEKCGLYLFRA